MIIYSKISLHAFGSGSTGYSSIWRNDIINCRSEINSNIPVIKTNSSLTNDTSIIGTSQADIVGMVFLSMNNAISIDPLNGANLNKPSCTL